jgi:type IV pilus assembly protein PilV
MSIMSRKSSGRQEAGFGLIEVLASVLVLAVGVMGFAALQLRAVQTSGDSYYRTQAMSIAQDLAERARSNSTVIATYVAAATWPTTAVDQTQLDDCMVGNCTPAQMVTFDAASVRFNAETLLPQGLVNMAACQGSALNCIYVSWDGLLPTAGAAGQCVDAAGIYKNPPPNKPAISCIMLEVQ